MEKFWLVWNPDGGKPKTVHQSYAGASSEARRLAGEFPNQQFYVMEAVGKAESIANVSYKELPSTKPLPEMQEQRHVPRFFNYGARD